MMRTRTFASSCMIMIKFLFSFLMLSASLDTMSQPGTEIYLVDLKKKEGEMIMSAPVNITNRKGYDNQPFFHPDKPLLYFVSADSTGNTDIMVYNYKTNILKKLTQTPEREYSPTITPDKKFISCIILRDNGVQDLAKYPVEGGSPTLIINNLTVGYHAWADPENVFVFILGEPNTLRRYSMSHHKDTVLAENIGRSLGRIPGTNAVSFVHKVSETQWLIKKVEPGDKITTLIETLPGREFFTWTPDGEIVMSDDKKVFLRTPDEKSSWREIEIQLPATANGITRMAINRKGDRAAVVMNE